MKGVKTGVCIKIKAVDIVPLTLWMWQNETFLKLHCLFYGFLHLTLCGAYDQTGFEVGNKVTDV